MEAKIRKQLLSQRFVTDSWSDLLLRLLLYLRQNKKIGNDSVDSSSDSEHQTWFTQAAADTSSMLTCRSVKDNIPALAKTLENVQIHPLRGQQQWETAVTQHLLIFKPEAFEKLRRWGTFWGKDLKFEAFRCKIRCRISFKNWTFVFLELPRCKMSKSQEF